MYGFSFGNSCTHYPNYACSTLDAEKTTRRTDEAPFAGDITVGVVGRCSQYDTTPRLPCTAYITWQRNLVTNQ